MADTRQKYMMIRVTLVQPSEANGATAEDTAALVALAGVDATYLHGPRELAAVAAVRIEEALTTLLQQYAEMVAAYNEANPLPESPAADGQEEKEVEFQA